MNVNAILLKPIDGNPVGSSLTLDLADFDRLKGMSAVRKAGDDDPTPEQASEHLEMLARFQDPVDGPRMMAAMKANFEAGLVARAGLSDTIVTLRAQLDDLQREFANVQATLDLANGRIAELETAAASKADTADDNRAGRTVEKMMAAPANKMAAPPANKTKG